MPLPTVRLLTCPACGGPLDLPAGASSMKCLYCANTIIIPENLRTPKQSNQPSPSTFGNIAQSALAGRGSEWAQVISMARSGNKAEAVEKYQALTGLSESDAHSAVDVFATSESYDAAQMAAASAYWSNPTVLAKYTGLSLASSGVFLLIGCGGVAILLTAFVMVIAKILSGF